MSVILTQPVAVDSTNNGLLYQLAVGSTQSIDSVPIVDIISVKWFISLRDVVTLQTCVYEVMAIVNGAVVDFNIHNITGTLITNNTEVSLMGGTHMVISITNNTTNVIEIRSSKNVLEL